MTARVICAGTAVLDQVYAVDALPSAAGKHFARAYEERPGGPSAIAAATVARLGGAAVWWGRVGEDAAGTRLLDALAGAGVETGGAGRVPGGRTPVSAVVIDAGGERLIVNYTDPDLDPDPGFLPLGRIADAGAVLADSRWPAGGRAVLAAARAAGVPAVLDADATPDGAAGDLMRQASHVVFSAQGLAQTTGERDPAAGLAAARSSSDAFLAVTLGAEGCLHDGPHGRGHVPAVPVRAVDTLGAGDVFHGAFALALAEDRDAVAALTFASAAAAGKCAAGGGLAALPDRAAVDALQREAVS